VTFFVTAKPFSLSLRERAGVRGKSASNCIDRAKGWTPNSAVYWQSPNFGSVARNEWGADLGTCVNGSRDGTTTVVQ
jgi:hypothetical protein